MATLIASLIAFAIGWSIGWIMCRRQFIKDIILSNKGEEQ